MERDEVDRFLETARDNLLVLESRLNSLGYRFENPQGAVQFADDSAVDLLCSLERQFGELPLLFRRWYETFRRVDFSQDHSQLYGIPGDRVAGLGWNCPLVFREIDWCLRTSTEMVAELSEEERAALPTDRVFLPIGGHGSNCDPKGVWVPDTTVDPILYDEGFGPISMSQEVARILEDGGFPFWRMMFRRRPHCRFSLTGVMPDFDTIYPILVRDFRPL